MKQHLPTDTEHNSQGYSWSQVVCSVNMLLQMALLCSSLPFSRTLGQGAPALAALVNSILQALGRAEGKTRADPTVRFLILQNRDGPSWSCLDKTFGFKGMYSEQK